MKKKPSSDPNGRLKLSDMVSAGSLLKFSLIFFFNFAFLMCTLCLIKNLA